MFSRRNFLNRTLGVGVALATPGTQQTAAQAPGAQNPRKRTIVDTQIHLWKAESDDWKWVGAKPQLLGHMPEPFTIEQAVLQMDEAGVDRAVVVPPSWTGDRNDYGLEAAKRYPNRFGVMGRIPLQNPKSAELLPKWKEQTGMLGVRLTLVGPAEKWLTDGTADWFWPAAEKAGIPVMYLALGKGTEMARVAERHPQLQLITWGMALPVEAVKAGNFQFDDMLALAKYPNVSVKLSAALNYSREPYPHRDMHPHIKRMFDTFGPRRCYWGTDITRVSFFGAGSEAQASWRQRVAHFEALDFLSEEDKDWVMGRAILARLGWV